MCNKLESRGGLYSSFSCLLQSFPATVTNAVFHDCPLTHESCCASDMYVWIRFITLTLQIKQMRPQDCVSSKSWNKSPTFGV